MSKQMKILVGVLGVVVLAMVVLTMFGKPPNLPLGPLQGMLAKDDTTVVDDTTVIDAGGAGLGTTGGQLCDPVTGMPIDSGAGAGTGTGTTGGTTDPLAGGAGTGTGTPADPTAGATGTTTDPAAGATGTTTDPATSTTPSSSAPVAAGADGWSDGSRVVAAGGAYDGGRVPDTWVAAADAATTGTTDPAATGTTDPAATGTTDPAATGTVDPAATGAVDPAATTGAATDPSATGGAASGGVPCDQVGAGAGSGAGAGAGATGGTGATGGAAATGAGRSTTDGTNSGNNPEALRAAKDASTVMQKANITVSSTATLVPGTGGIGRPATLKRYRATVTSATIVIKLDSSAMTEWTGAGKKVQINLVKSFLTRMRKSYPKSARSITITDAQGNVLAIGDASVGGTSGTVKLF